MSRSDWIALAACIASFLALIPICRDMMKGPKRRNKDEEPIAKVSPVEPSGKGKDEVIKEPPSTMWKAFVLTIMAVVIGLIELIVFSWIAYLFGVPVDYGHMPIAWNLAFGALFIIPGCLLFFALMFVTSLFKD